MESKDKTREAGVRVARMVSISLPVMLRFLSFCERGRLVVANAFGCGGGCGEASLCTCTTPWLADLAQISLLSYLPFQVPYIAHALLYISLDSLFAWMSLKSQDARQGSAISSCAFQIEGEEGAYQRLPPITTLTRRIQRDGRLFDWWSGTDREGGLHYLFPFSHSHLLYII